MVPLCKYIIDDKMACIPSMTCHCVIDAQESLMHMYVIIAKASLMHTNSIFYPLVLCTTRLQFVGCGP